MTTPTGIFTVMEAAEAWINMIESPETKSTPEQKASLVSKIREAAPKTYLMSGRNKDTFVMATNEIKAVIKGEKFLLPGGRVRSA